MSVYDISPVTGEILFRGPPPWICGRCGSMPQLCPCESSSGGRDLVLKHLPPPLPNSTPEQLLRRWVSAVSLSPTMSVLDARRWANDNAAVAVTAMDQRAERLKLLVDAYKARLPREAIYGDVSKELSPMWYAIRQDEGWSEETKLMVVRNVLDSAMRAFLAGDWACVTRVGSLLLMEAFPLKEEWPQHELLRDDPSMEALFDAAMFLYGVLTEGYSAIGGSLAVEDSLDGACPARWHEWYRDFIAENLSQGGQNTSS